MTVVDHGTPSRPLESLDVWGNELDSASFYVEAGGQVRIRDYDDDEGYVAYKGGAMPPGLTLTVDRNGSATISGTMPPGTYTLEYEEYILEIDDYIQFTITLVGVGGDSYIAKMSVKVSGQWKSGLPWVNDHGTWKRAVAVWVKTGGVWKRNQ